MKTKMLICIWMVLVSSLSGWSQNSRTYIRNQIKAWGSCRNVAVTHTGGDLALNQDNAYAYSGIPRTLAKSIDELHDEGHFIDDIQLTEDGNWLILYGNNGFRWNNISPTLEAKLREYNSKEEVVTSVTFNDRGGWIVISKNYISASSTEVYDWIKQGITEFGSLWAAHMTDDGLVLCYENGYKFMGKVPQNLRKKLKETDINVYRVKFLSDGTYFIADSNGRYGYYM